MYTSESPGSTEFDLLINYKEHDTEIIKTCVSDMFAVPNICKCISLFFLAPDSFLFLFSKKENY